MMPPTGKKKTKASEARTACAVMITRPRSANSDRMPPFRLPPPLLLLLELPPKELPELELELELELESESPPRLPKL